MLHVFSISLYLPHIAIFMLPEYYEPHHRAHIPLIVIIRKKRLKYFTCTNIPLNIPFFSHCVFIYSQHFSQIKQELAVVNYI